MATTELQEAGTKFHQLMTDLEEWELQQAETAHQTALRMHAGNDLYEALSVIVKEFGYCMPSKYLEPANRALAKADGD